MHFGRTPNTWVRNRVIKYDLDEAKRCEMICEPSRLPAAAGVRPYSGALDPATAGTGHQDSGAVDPARRADLMVNAAVRVG